MILGKLRRAGCGRGAVSRDLALGPGRIPCLHTGGLNSNKDNDTDRDAPAGPDAEARAYSRRLLNKGHGV